MNKYQFTNKIVAKVTEKSPKSLDPISLAILIAVISQLVSYITKRCLDRLPEPAQAALIRRQLKKACREKEGDIKKIGGLSWEEVYQTYKDLIPAAAIEVRNNATPDEIKALLSDLSLN